MHKEDCHNCGDEMIYDKDTDMWFCPECGTVKEAEL